MVSISFLRLCLLTSLLAAFISASAQTERCKTNADCSDAVFCNGYEICSPNSSRADARGCIPGPPPDCDDRIACTIDSCNEAQRRCENLPPDRDGDGAGDKLCLDRLGVPLGRDCDDNNPLRFGGNLEVCDPHGLDEDCDLTTFGSKDEDGDGFIDAICRNYEFYQ
ncbi:MAG: putative metal-binding motif-containing protein [Pseudomonadota bacterium]